MAGSGCGPRKDRKPCKTMTIKFVKSSETFQTGPACDPPSAYLVSGTEYDLKDPTIPQVKDPVPQVSQFFDSDNCIQIKDETPCVKDTSSPTIEGSNKKIVGSRIDDVDVSQAVKTGGQCASLNVHAVGSFHVSKHKVSGSSRLTKGNSQSQAPAITFSWTPEAKPILTKEEYMAAWKGEKDPQLEKFRKLAYEVVALRTDRPNAKDKIHSAANRVPIRVDFNTEPIIGFKKSNSFIGYVFVDGVSVASGQGVRIKDSKTNAYEAALQKILMPHMRIVRLYPESCELEASKEPFMTPPPEPFLCSVSKSDPKSSLAVFPKMPGKKITTLASTTEKRATPLQSTLKKATPSPSTSEKATPLQSTSQKAPSFASTVEKVKPIREVSSVLTESNLEAACLKRRLNEKKTLEEFVIVEPLVPTSDCTPAHTLRRSADFNHMLLEYEYTFKGEAARCVLRVEDHVIVDVNGISKMAAKNLASSQALDKLKNLCWVIKTKKAVDSDTKISKDEMLSELIEMNDQSETIGCDNIGNRLLRKMGWSGGGVGKNGSGIVEPVTLKSILNREGLGLSAKKGITEDFKKRVREVIENYAVSGSQEDLVFDYNFCLDERQIIHDESRRLNLRSKCRGKGHKRYLCVRRKLTATELFDHIMSSGGETARYILVPPGGGQPGSVSDSNKWNSSMGLAAVGGPLRTYKPLTRHSRRGTMYWARFGPTCSARGLLSTPTGKVPLVQHRFTHVPGKESDIQGMRTTMMRTVISIPLKNCKASRTGENISGCKSEFSVEIGGRKENVSEVNSALWNDSSGLGNVHNLQYHWGMQQNMGNVHGLSNQCNSVYSEDKRMFRMGNGYQVMVFCNNGLKKYNHDEQDSICGNHNMGNVNYSNQSISGNYVNQNISGNYVNQNISGRCYGNQNISGSYCNQDISGSYSNQDIIGNYNNGDSDHMFENCNPSMRGIKQEIMTNGRQRPGMLKTERSREDVGKQGLVNCRWGARLHDAGGNMSDTTMAGFRALSQQHSGSEEPRIGVLGTEGLRGKYEMGMGGYGRADWLGGRNHVSVGNRGRGSKKGRGEVGIGVRGRGNVGLAVRGGYGS